MNFDEFMESCKPQNIKASDLFAGKIRFCLAGNAELIEGNYQNKTTYQHRVDVAHMVANELVTDTVYLPGHKVWQNFFKNVDSYPQFSHNLYLVKDGQAYAIKQATGPCPCSQAKKKQANGKIEEPEDISDILADYGFESESQEPPINSKQAKAINLLTKGKVDTTGWSESEAEQFLLELKQKHAGVKA